jgi:hypothetical protein
VVIFVTLPHFDPHDHPVLVTEVIVVLLVFIVYVFVYVYLILTREAVWICNFYINGVIGDEWLSSFCTSYDPSSVHWGAFESESHTLYRTSEQWGSGIPIWAFIYLLKDWGECRWQYWNLPSFIMFLQTMPVVIYEYEIWSHSGKNIDWGFLRSMLGRTFGPKREAGG